MQMQVLTQIQSVQGVSDEVALWEEAGPRERLRAREVQR